MPSQSTKNFNPRTPYGMRRYHVPTLKRIMNFNPRTPYGMRLYQLYLAVVKVGFQSTHPLRDATQS